MEGSDLNYYFNWIKTQLSSQVKDISFSIFARNVTSMLSQAIYGNYGKWQKESYIKIMPFWTRWVSQITLRYGTLLHFFFLWLASAQPFLSFLPLGIFHSRWKYLLSRRLPGSHRSEDWEDSHNSKEHTPVRLMWQEKKLHRGESAGKLWGWETSGGSTHICLSWIINCGRNLGFGRGLQIFLVGSFMPF